MNMKTWPRVSHAGVISCIIIYKHPNLETMRSSEYVRRLPWLTKETTTTVEDLVSAIAPWDWALTPHALRKSSGNVSCSNYLAGSNKVLNTISKFLIVSIWTSSQGGMKDTEQNRCCFCKEGEMIYHILLHCTRAVYLVATLPYLELSGFN